MPASRARRRFEKLLLIAGLAGVALWVGSIVRTGVSQYWANRAFEEKLHRSQTHPPAPPLIVEPPIEPNQVIGRLAIPRLKLQAMVREGAGARTLDLALGHIPGTAMPGQAGNVGVAGHRDALFRGIGKIRKADRIQFQTLSGNYEYEVESTSIVEPRQVSVLEAGGYPEITLVTCYPFYYVGSAPQRFIVKARLVSSPASGVAPAAPPQPVQPVMAQNSRKPQPTGHRVFFQISEGHSRTLVPGISLGLEWADAGRQRINGWMWVTPDRRTIWLSSQRPREPLVFYLDHDGKRRELVITAIGQRSVRGYLQLPGG